MNRLALEGHVKSPLTGSLQGGNLVLEDQGGALSTLYHHPWVSPPPFLSHTHEL